MRIRIFACLKILSSASNSAAAHFRQQTDLIDFTSQTWYKFILQRRKTIWNVLALPSHPTETGTKRRTFANKSLSNLARLMIHLSENPHGVIACERVCLWALQKCQIALIDITRWENEFLPTVANWNTSQGKQGCNPIMYQGVTPPGCGASMAVLIHLRECVYVCFNLCVVVSLKDEGDEREERGRRE